ncbi:SH3 domain-containing protein [Devosia sp. CN2-171]|uniref:SH3 domain-containing protein n=1 Tax=Devosia sp. CN2-171 TaxID=3400909 RepID=UPI003BF8370F
MAGVGTLAVVAVLAGLQCGGIDRCFVAETKVASAAIEPAEAAEAPVAEERLIADQVIAAKPAAAPAPAVDTRAQQIAALIGGSFEAIRADDEGWLTGAYAPAEPATAQVEEGDGPGPAVASVADTAPAGGTASGAEAVAAIAALEQPVKPLDRPKPLAVTAFAEVPEQTAPTVTAAAEKQLADVAAKVAPAKEEPVKEEAEAPAAEPVKVAAVESTDVRTVAGSGANVRSGPGKSNKSLFTLAGGEQVKVGENQRGWLKITDDQGRTGWIYKTYLN